MKSGAELSLLNQYIVNLLDYDIQLRSNDLKNIYSKRV